MTDGAEVTEEAEVTEVTEEPRVRPVYLRWTTLAPVLAILALLATWGREGLGPVPLVLVAVLLGSRRARGGAARGDRRAPGR